MANKKYEETDVQAIAEAIREKTGSEDSYKVSDMASGVNEVYEAGKTKEWNDFWDNFQNKGARDNYHYAFGTNAWNEKTWKPKWDIKPRYAVEMFVNCGIRDLEQAIKDSNIVFDTSNVESFSNFIRYNHSILVVPELSTISSSTLTNMFNNSTRITTIRKLILKGDGSQEFTGVFTNCSSLTSITFEGVIGRNISFSYSPLSVESMKSVITHLKNYSGTESEFAYTVTFKTSAFEALEAEGATAEYNGVACTWAELIDNLKWNLVKA